jgi:AraC-like DNA-binding protein
MKSILALAPDVYFFEVVFLLLAVTAGLAVGAFAHLNLFSRSKREPEYSLMLKKAAKECKQNLINKRAARPRVWRNRKCYPAEILEASLANISSLYTFSQKSCCVTIKYQNQLPTAYIAATNICSMWLTKAIDELLKNALKHNHGQEYLTLSAKISCEEGYLLISIGDDGHGISQNITSKLNNIAEPLSPIVTTLFSDLDVPVNLFSIQSHLHQIKGSLDLVTARRFLTRITMGFPLQDFRDEVKPAAAPTEPRRKHSRERPNQYVWSESLPSQQLPIDEQSAEHCSFERFSAELSAIKECISEYRLSKICHGILKGPESAKFVEQFNQLLSDCYRDDSFSRPIAAKKMLMTEKTLARRLKKYYNLGFVTTLKKFRLQRAQNLLIEGAKVTDVAFDSGFSSASYFTRCFKAEYGFTPSALSKIVHESNEQA